MRKLRIIVGVIVLLAAFGWQYFGPGGLPGAGPAPAITDVGGNQADTAAQGLPAFLPPQAHHTLELIARGGPYPFDQDGTVFQNREQLLPSRPRGYYHEFTVITPGAPTRGARRIVTGGNPPEVYYYTDDHYRSFRAFRVGH